MLSMQRTLAMPNPVLWPPVGADRSAPTRLRAEAPSAERAEQAPKKRSKRDGLPAPRAIDWRMKPLESAKTTCRRVENGKLEMTIQHDLIRGVTPEMVVWWFKHAHEDTVWKGKRIPVYHVWHPTDHIALTILRPGEDGGTGMSKGARIRIEEMFGGTAVRREAEVEKLDEEGLTLVFMEGPLKLGRLEHRFEAKAEGTQYNSRVTVGSDVPVLKHVINAYVRGFMFNAENGKEWLKHNVEEVGNLQYFLPKLFRDRAR